MKIRLWGLAFIVFGMAGSWFCKDLTPAVISMMFGFPALIFGDTSKVEESDEQS